MLDTNTAEMLDDSDAHDALARIYAEGGRWAELAELHAKRFDAVADPRERASLLRKIASILRERFDDDARAFEVLLDALREDFTDEETVRDLEALARWNDRFGELLVACNDWLRDPEIAGATRAALLTRVGTWYGDELGKPAWGLPYLEEARALAPNDVRVLRALVRVNTTAGALSPCEPVLRRILELDPSDRDAANMLERLVLGRNAVYDLVAFFERRLRDSQSVALNGIRLKLAALHATLPGGDVRACELLEEAHALDTADVEVLRALDARLAASKRWADLGPILEERIDRAETEEERVELLVRLAKLHEDHDLDADRAAQRLEQVVELAPSNDEAWRALERCYGKLRLWDAAVFAYERHVDAVEDVDARVAAYAAMARVLDSELGLRDRALEAYAAALDLDRARISVLELVARLHERSGDVPRALAAMEQIVEHAADPARRVAALCELAAAYRTRASDSVRARTLYRSALEIDPGNTLALSALRQLALDCDDVAEAARLLDREQRHTENPRVRAKLLVELALLRRDRLDDARGSKHAFEEAHAEDPENDEANFAIAEDYVERNEWNSAEPLLERLARSSGKRPVYQQIGIFAQLGRTHLARGEHARALEAFRRAQRLGPVDVDIVEGIAEAAFAVGALDDALSAQQKVLTACESALDRAASLHRLGEIYLRLGDERRARLNYERALEAEERFRPSLRALIDLRSAENDWDEVATLEDQLLEGCAAEDRFALLRESAKRWSERAVDHRRAAAALEAALALAPDDRRVLLDLLRAREALDDKPGIIEAIDRLLAMEQEPAVRARYRLTIASLAEELGDRATAAAAYDAALDDDPRALDAFRALERLLVDDASELELAYRKMIHRARTAADDELAFELWHKLGVVYRDRLRDSAASLECFRMASRLRPDDSRERRIIADLCVATDRTDLAIAELQQAVAREPMEATHHQALYRLYARTGELDRAYCAASVLVFLKGANAEQRACYAELRPRGAPEFRARLGRAAWIRDLSHPDLDRTVGALFEVIGRAARAAKLRTLSARDQLPSLANARPEDRHTTQRLAAKAFFGAAAVLGVEAPQLLIRPDLAGAVAAVPVEPAASLVGASLLAGWSVPELMFMFGKHLTLQQGEHAVRAHFPSMSELETLLAAAVRIVAPSLGRAPAAVHRAQTALARELREDEQERLGDVVSALLDLEGRPDVQRWMQCSELTAVRAGLILAGDLSVAAKILRQEPVVAGDLSPTEKVRELVRFTVSDAHASLRTSLGIAVQSRPIEPSDDGDDEPTLERALCA